MAWNYPDISLEEMLKLIKGFVDIMILASGYQSSGLLAHWDPPNIKKAFHWASFFETVLRQMGSSDVYLDSIKELDAVLHEMTSDPRFPQGLKNLSYATLSKARSFVLVHLFHGLPLRESHLRALLTAIIEMEIDQLSEPADDGLNLYLKKLALQNMPSDFVRERSVLVEKEESVVTSEDSAATRKIRNCPDNDLTKFTLQELCKRQSAVSCISTLQSGLDILSNSLRCSSQMESDSIFMREQSNYERATALTGTKDQLDDLITWNRWKSDNLSYFLDKRIVRLVSGASMIFSAPKIQWEQVLSQLNVSGKCEDGDYLETIELILLGCIGSKWSSIIEYFISVSYDSFTMSKLYDEVCNIPGISQSSHSKEEVESSILEYLAGLLGGKLHPLWQLFPVLTAVAIPSWSPLFRLYLSEIENQFKGDSTMRCCSCIQDRKEHKHCQLAERLWCLHIFHVCGRHVLYGANNA